MSIPPAVKEREREKERDKTVVTLCAGHSCVSLFDMRCMDETVRRNERFRALRNSSVRTQEREQIYQDLQLLFLLLILSYSTTDLATQICILGNVFSISALKCEEINDTLKSKQK